MGAVIGSGWLFSSFDAAQIGGGGGAVTAWILGISLVLVLAFVHAELGTMFPVDGGTARFPLYAFGRVTGFFSGWFAWISTVCVPAIETEAALRYVGNYVPSLISQSPGVVRLTPLGQLVAVFVLLGFTALNAAGMRSFRETNTVVVWWKIAIPLIVAIAFVVHGFDRHNFTVGGLFPSGAHGVLAAISTGGVVFALLGFEQAVELGGETKHPQRNVPVGGHRLRRDRRCHLSDRAGRLHRCRSPRRPGQGLGARFASRATSGPWLASPGLSA